jgi:hypothetical protein
VLSALARPTRTYETCAGGAGTFDSQPSKRDVCREEDLPSSAAATVDDHAFVVEMACHACIIEDQPIPEPDYDEVLGCSGITGLSE